MSKFPFSSLIHLSVCSALTIVFAASQCQAEDGAPDIRKSVVKISTTARFPNSFMPWTKQTSTHTGTGTVISNKRILTNSHVVLYGSEILVHTTDKTEKFEAEIQFVAPEIDLAILKVKDETFFDNIPAVEIADSVPERGSNITVYGYPVGGDNLSITQGVVSRMEAATLTSKQFFQRIQVDAAVNPGNSGGPAINNGKLVGVTYANAPKAENIGYLISATDVQDLLADVEDGKLDGPSLWYHHFQTLESSSLRKWLKLKTEQTGIMVMKVIHADPDSLPLKPFDTITSVAGHSIANDGLIEFPDKNKMPFAYAIQKWAKDGKVELGIVRDGEAKTIELPVANELPFLIQSAVGSYPSYFVYGPLAFSNVTRETLKQIRPEMTAALVARKSPLLSRQADLPKLEGEELVIVCSNPFPSPLMKGLPAPTLGTLAAINGQKVKNLRHAAELFLNCKDEFVVLDFADERLGTLVFSQKDLAKSTESILQDNSIRSQTSPDLADLFK